MRICHDQPDSTVFMETLLNEHASETELIQSAQPGDLEAFNLLIPSYLNLLFRIAPGLLKVHSPTPKPIVCTGCGKPVFPP